MRTSLALFLLLILLQSAFAESEETGVNSVEEIEQGMTSVSISAESETESRIESLIEEARERGRNKITLEPVTKDFKADVEGRSNHELTTVEQEGTLFEHSAALRDELLKKLQSQILILRDEALLSRVAHSSTQRPVAKRHVGSTTVFDFLEGELYTVYGALHRVTNIELGAGEVLTAQPMAGDTVRWSFESFRAGPDNRTHILVKPKDEEIETNLILATNKRTYHIKLISGEQYMAGVRWNYPDEELREVVESYRRSQQVEEIATNVESLNFGYSIEKTRYSFAPEKVFDDGEKTYLKMPLSLAVGEAPVLFVLDDSGDAMLVNYRVRGQYYVVDRLFERAELRVGKKEAVEVRSKSYRGGFFGRSF